MLDKPKVAGSRPAPPILKEKSDAGIPASVKRTMTTQLLTREEFRKAVFKRDHGCCVLCGSPAQDAHHLIERRLWSDGGYYVDNGVALCAEHHLAAERTLVSVEELRAAAGIYRIVLPLLLEDGADEIYTKWGDIVLADGRRSPGELFDDESVQKALREGNVLDLYTKLIKYPRTIHLPWSQGRSREDIGLADTGIFEGREVVVTEKMDGENTTLTRERVYARSIDGLAHPSQAWVRALHGTVGWEIPDGWRFCGENLYAEHSIHYQDLPSFFLLFNVWTDRNICLCWDETKTWAELLGLDLVPVLYRGIWDETMIRDLWNGENEGYVVRLADELHYKDFRQSVAKFVRPNHVTTDRHWRHKPVVSNRLKQIP